MVSSIYPDQGRGAWILAQRPAREPVDPDRPRAWFLENERAATGQAVQSAVILLTNKECPWRCLMCDLWRHTTAQAVPPGAIVRQIDYALSQLAGRPAQLKLYNSGSFFDPAAIPEADYPAIAHAAAFASHVVVESHPRLVGPKTWRFQNLLPGSLEVAMGLETIHPQVLPKLNKRMDPGHFARAAESLVQRGVLVRAFVLVQPPFMAEGEAVEWAAASARFAFDCGASVVSLIPTRPGNGALDRLLAAGEFAPPRLATLERALAAGLELRRGRVFADTWDLAPFAACPSCLAARTGRLEAMNLQQRILPRAPCPACPASGQPALGAPGAV